ncbi:MAG: DUF4215 domain-containing protein [Nannocystaceae bacterium]
MKSWVDRHPGLRLATNGLALAALLAACGGDDAVTETDVTTTDSSTTDGMTTAPTTSSPTTSTTDPTGDMTGSSTIDTTAGTTDEPTTDEPTTDEPTTDEPTTDEPTTEPPAVCGDGVVDGDEVCDDGNDDNTDDCLDTCEAASCGDGYTWAGAEECDDGGESDLCDEDCTVAACGDGTLNQLAGEGCDDGNTDPDDGCSPECLIESCGDGVVQAMEECDDGNDDNSDDCLDTCLLASCGDGVIWQDNEECDDGKETDVCDDDCTLPACGDGTLNMSAGEECDDGNDVDTDDCPTTCVSPTCGDGFVWEGNEECDDGNNDPNDGCSAMCALENCFKFSNTDQEDLMGPNWFDACVDAPGTNITIVVRDANNQIVYQGNGVKVGVWTYDQLTSTATPNNQYEVTNHNRAIVMDNGDLLRISGRNSNNSGCGGSQGNGYVIMTYDNPIVDTYYNRIKLLVAPYLHTVNSNSPRNFGNWTPAGELSWNNDMNQYSCFPFFGPGPALTPFIGSVEFRVY